MLLIDALKRGASDIHIEPYEKEFRVRFRIDGILYNVMALPMKLRDPLISRLKIMAKLDISEKRLPQDGRIKIRLKVEDRSRDMDFRVSSLPTLWGEKVVLRLLDKTKLMLDMTKLGFEPESLERFKRAIAKPYGIVLVTGPTGSGKTNTLYSAIAAAQQAGHQHHDRRGPGGVQPARASTRSRSRTRSASTSRPPCARSCARTRTSSWWARSATTRRRRSRSRPRSPATSCSPPCTPTTRPPRSRAS